MDREALRQAAMPQTQDVPVPQWKATFTIRQMDTLELLKMDERDPAEDEKLSLALGVSIDRLSGARQVVACTIDKTTREPVFTEADIPELVHYSAAGFVVLNGAISKLNGLSPDLAKN